MSSNLPHDFEDNPAGLQQYNEWAKTQRSSEEVK
jgi:cytochrome c oxidase subunit 1